MSITLVDNSSLCSCKAANYAKVNWRLKHHHQQASNIKRKLLNEIIRSLNSISNADSEDLPERFARGCYFAAFICEREKQRETQQTAIIKIASLVNERHTLVRLRWSGIRIGFWNDWLCRMEFFSVANYFNLSFVTRWLKNWHVSASFWAPYESLFVSLLR